MRVLILGSNPSTKGGTCPTIRKLKTWLDALDLNIVSFCNVANSHGPISLKDVKREYIHEISQGYDKIITLGATAGYALSLMGIRHYSLPHPSGLNRKLNQPGFIEQELSKCREYLWA
jgi:hypothetical protein